MLSRLAISGNVWGGSTSSDVSAVYNYDPKKKTYSFLEVSIGDIQEHPLGVYLGKNHQYYKRLKCRRRCRRHPRRRRCVP
jgi:hypothetical protein